MKFSAGLLKNATLPATIVAIGPALKQQCPGGSVADAKDVQDVAELDSKNLFGCAEWFNQL
jgi:hypothetical protein